MDTYNSYSSFDSGEHGAPFIESQFYDAQIPGPFVDDLTDAVEEYHRECAELGKSEERTYALIGDTIDYYRRNVLGKIGPDMRKAHDTWMTHISNELQHLDEDYDDEQDRERDRKRRVRAGEDNVRKLSGEFNAKIKRSFTGPASGGKRRRGRGNAA